MTNATKPPYTIKAGNFIRLQHEYGYLMDFVVEEYQFCLGVFMSESHRRAGDFTPLCILYGPGPDSEEQYEPNYGQYKDNLVPGWMDITEIVHRNG